MGLTISTRLVNLMGGNIWVESVPGQGSCFHFTARFAITRIPEGDARPNEIWLDGIRALVVDDNLTNRRVLMGTLNGWKLRPSAAASGAEAIQMLRSAKEQGDPYSIIVTNVHMPEMDGFELAAKVKGMPELAKAVVLMLTSGHRQGDVALCRELGVPVYLTKPVARTDLRAAIVAALGLSANPTETSYEDAREQSTRRTGSRLRILLTEDNVVNQCLASRILQKEGHGVVIAGNGREALAALAKSEFDVVLMDVQMPEMDGFEATAAIRKSEMVTGNHVPIIAMTAHAMSGDRERCLGAGMDEYVSKPIGARALLNVIEKCAAVAHGNP